MKKLCCVLLILFLVPAFALAAGTSSVTSDSGNEYNGKAATNRKVVVTWTADAADGSVPDCRQP